MKIEVESADAAKICILGNKSILHELKDFEAYQFLDLLVQLKKNIQDTAENQSKKSKFKQKSLFE